MKPMSNDIRKIVILGGGSAGWLTAGLIAAEHMLKNKPGMQVTLLESPDIKPIGVGEGTWPTMRTTLSKIGVSETDFFRECDASFKQGAKFAKWVTGKDDDFYYHPLVLPKGYGEIDHIFQWQEQNTGESFEEAICFQGTLCEEGLAPKQITTPEYAGVANYAYHLDAGKFGVFLQRHCTSKLGVTHILDNMVSVNSAENGDISSLATQHHGDIEGDLFIDCSGFASLLLGKHYGVPFIEKKHILFNDAALAVQVPYQSEEAPIASHTISTAQSAGWVWDIGLPTRRGVGYVYSSSHISDERAEAELHKYIESTSGEKAAQALSARKISINPGHREMFWHKNCVAVGLSAGFLEPLEASALILVEMSAEMISFDMPANRDVMDIVARRFNERFRYRWDRIIDFLKFHYILTKRTDSDYWVDNCREASIPDRVLELMHLWRYAPPGKNDFHQIDEVFGSASWQYVLYGMGFKTLSNPTSNRANSTDLYNQYCAENQNIKQKYLAGLPGNRELIGKIRKFGMQRV